jgi:type II secretory pathway pseudopilin PulG
MIARGFTLVELLVSTTVTLCVTAALLAVVSPTRDIFTAESEASDMQQRIRIAQSMLFRDLMMAGAGTDFGPDAGPLADFVPAVLPYRLDRGGDAPGSFRSDAVTLVYVPSAKAQTTIAHAMPAQSGDVRVNISPGCSLNDDACGLSQAGTALVYESTGAFDLFAVTGATGSLLHVRHTFDDSPAVFPAGSRIVQAIVRSYFLRVDPQTGSQQLMRGDGDGGPLAPVVDHVVGLSFEYFGSPAPPAMRADLADPAGPWTTYGPKPPLPDLQPTTYPPGENCVFTTDGMTPGSRLPSLEPDAPGTLARLTAEELTDGPWCPDAAHANRFDADLLRLRKIRVTVRVESAIDQLRGPAGVFFSRPGSSRGGRQWLPDLEIRFTITPRNLNLAR